MLDDFWLPPESRSKSSEKPARGSHFQLSSGGGGLGGTVGKVGDSGKARQEGGGAECQAGGAAPTPRRRRLSALARSCSRRGKLGGEEPRGSAPEVIFQLLRSVADRGVRGEAGSLWLQSPPPGRGELWSWRQQRTGNYRSVQPSSQEYEKRPSGPRRRGSGIDSTRVNMEGSFPLEKPPWWE